ncbi:MAG: hypothetical protein RLZZ277_740 [Actinomycetota bacterium]
MKSFAGALTAAATALLALSLSPSVQAATTNFGSGVCVQTVDGLTGTSAQEGDYCVVALKSGTGTWTVPTGVSAIQYMIVGGGGGGGAGNSSSAGGGGAGALYETTEPFAVTAGTAIGATVGTGGNGGTAGTAGSNGADSTFNSVIAYGGGGGSALPNNSVGTAPASRTGYGGSGGGAIASPVGAMGPTNAASAPAASSNSLNAVTATGGAAGASGSQTLARNSGGNSNAAFPYFTDIQKTVSFWLGGGGGGADSAGGNISWSSSGTPATTTFSPGVGGSGKFSNLLNSTTAGLLGVGEISNSKVYFAGGGAGHGNFNAAGWTFTGMSYSLSPAGGVGGGGGGNSGRTIYTAPNTTVAVSAAGAVNTGGGGRGAGAVGGTGVILIRYLATTMPTMSGVSFSATPRKSTYTTITFEMNVPGKTQFRINGKRIANCISRATSGSGNSYSSTCTWKPAFIGPQQLSVIATPTDTSIAPATFTTGVNVAPRSATR